MDVGLIIVLTASLLVLVAINLVIGRSAVRARALDDRCADLGFEAPEAIRFRGAFRLPSVPATPMASW